MVGIGDGGWNSATANESRDTGNIMSLKTNTRE
jgi:hypothetical protein